MKETSFWFAWKEQGKETKENFRKEISEEANESKCCIFKWESSENQQHSEWRLLLWQRGLWRNQHWISATKGITPLQRD